MAKKSLLRRLVTIIWGDWQTNDLWQRILKDFIACTIATIIASLPELASRSTFLIPMVVVFAHPGQRMGIMIEGLLMILFGAILGLSWSIFGLYLASLVVDYNQSAAYTIRALFLLINTLLHGYFRSSSPRLFTFVLFFSIPALLMLVVPIRITPGFYETIYVPILIGGGVLVFVNISIFPELSSSYLGTSTINALSEMVDTMERATHWFVTPGGDCIEPQEQDNGLATTMTGKSTKPLESDLMRNKAIRRWLKYFETFPNPFQSAKAMSTTTSIPLHQTTLANLTESKTTIRSQLSACKAAQNEVNFEISISPLAPSAMKPISTDCMSSLAQSVVILIGACENKYIVLGDDGCMEENTTRNSDPAPLPVYTEDPSQSPLPSPLVPQANLQPNPGTKTRRKEKKKGRPNRIDGVQLNRQIELSSAMLLESIVKLIREPVEEFQDSLKQAVILLILCLAYCYDVPKLPSGAFTPSGIPLEEIDLRIDAFTSALELFDERSAERLKQIAMHEPGQVLDFMPRMETFLLSSFLLAFRQSSTHILQMLRHARHLVEKRQRRHDRLRVWLPQFTNFRKWLSTGGDYDAMVLPEGARQAARRGDLAGNGSSSDNSSSCLDDEQPSERVADEETGPLDKTEGGKSPNQKKPQTPAGRNAKSKSGTPKGWMLQVRGKAADALEWAQDSDDLSYAIKLAVAVFLVSWPAFIPSWNEWYADVRGSWAPIQLILIFEVAIGTSFISLFIRLFGVLLGCLCGYLACVIGGGSRPAMVVVLAFALLPFAYIHVATKYIKVGAVSIVSMTVVALAAVNNSTPAYEVFYKRLVAFLVGGVAAMLVEISISPVRARDRLVESLSASVRHIQNMNTVVAIGIDGPKMPNFRSNKLGSRFKRSREKAQASLAAAETFLPFCTSEPRLKGSFKPLAPVYKEIVYVLHQIIDRMDNVVQLRIVYGSSILEELNSYVYAYRRSVAAASTLMLFSVNEALTTWLPLPQFIPSARLAQLRLINRVREIITSQMSSASTPAAELSRLLGEEDSQLDEQVARLITKHNFLSWNASTAGQMEIIEYLEELVELVKLLVGVNAFRSGMLEKPNYKQYMKQMEAGRTSLDRIRSTRTGASTRRNSVSAAQAAVSEIQDPTLRSAVMTALRVERFRQKLRGVKDRGARTLGRNESNSEGGEDDVPVSLQRVSTRLWQDNQARRRSLTRGDVRNTPA